jgi:hypothetical protein
LQGAIRKNIEKQEKSDYFAKLRTGATAGVVLKIQKDMLVNPPLERQMTTK